MNFKRKEPQIEPPMSQPTKIDFQKLADDIEREDTPRVSEYAPRNNNTLSDRDRLDQGRRIGVATAQSFAALPIGQLDDLAKKHDAAKERFDAANTELRAHFEHVAEDLVNAYQREIESLEVDSNELEQLLVTIAQRRKPPVPPKDVAPSTRARIETKPKYEKPSIKEETPAEETPPA